MDKKFLSKEPSEAKITLADRIMHSSAMQYVIQHKNGAALSLFGVLLGISLFGWWHYRQDIAEGKCACEAARLKEEFSTALIHENGKTNLDLYHELVALSRKCPEIRKVYSGVVAQEALLENLPVDAEKHLASSKKELVENGLTEFSSFSDAVILLSQKRPREALLILQKIIDTPSSQQFPFLKAYCYLHKIVALKSLNKAEEKKDAISEFQKFLNSQDANFSADQKNYFLQNIDHGPFSLIQFLS